MKWYELEQYLENNYEFIGKQHGEEFDFDIHYDGVSYNVFLDNMSFNVSEFDLIKPTVEAMKEIKEKYGV